MAVDCTTDHSLDYDLPGWEITPDGIAVYVRVRSARLHIHVESPNFHRSPNAYNTLLSIKSKFESEGIEYDLWDYFEWLASQFLSEFRHLVPLVDHAGQLTLADLELHQYYECRLEFYDEVPRPGAISPMEQEPPDHYDWDSLDVAPPEWPFPRFQSSDVVVPYTDPTTVFDIIPEQVFVHGRPFFWKPSWMSVESKDAVEKYCKIHSSGMSLEQLRTSRLYGIVTSSRGVLRGQLYEWIDVKKHLTWNVLEQTPEATRSKWASQIQRSVSTLHSLNIIWGDVKAGNVVIDQDDDALVIDLEGGATRGWVDKEEQGTREGDLQGLERLVDYIFNDECPLRLRDKQLDQDEYMGCELLEPSMDTERLAV